MPPTNPPTKTRKRTERKDPLAYRPSPAPPPQPRPAPRFVPRASEAPLVPVAAPPPAAPRKRNRKRVPPAVLWNRRFRFLRNALLLALVCEAAFLALNAPQLRVRRVTVSGAHLKTPAQVAQIAGLTQPFNLFRTPARAAERRLGALPEVQSARVERRWPNTLAVVVKERRPAANVLTSSGRWVMDENGLVFRRVSAPLTGVPVLSVAASGAVSLGKTLPMTALRPALQCLAAIPSLPLSKNSVLHVEPTLEAWISTPDGFKVRLGPLDDAPSRMATVARILNGKDGPKLMRESAALDVTSPGNEVTVKRANMSDVNGSAGQ